MSLFYDEQAEKIEQLEKQLEDMRVTLRDLAEWTWNYFSRNHQGEITPFPSDIPILREAREVLKNV